MNVLWKVGAIAAIAVALAFGYALFKPSAAPHATAIVEEPQSATPARPPEVREGLRAGAGFGGLKIAATTKLGRNPLEADSGDCGGISRDQKSVGAALVRRLGWIPTSEISIDGYDAVSFAGKVENGTSGSCYVTDANVGIFGKKGLVALIYGAWASFAGVTSVDESPTGLIRLFGDTVNYDSAIADVVISDGVIAIAKLPDVEKFCNDKVEVPNVRNKLITTARKSLIHAGWEPIPADSDGYEEPLAQSGVIETQSCAGTGFGMCSFAYSHPLGPQLHVVSMGDASMVTGYRVLCTPD